MHCVKAHNNRATNLCRAINARVVPLGRGHARGLLITARRDDYRNVQYTSARLTTKRHPVAGQVLPPRHPDGNFMDGGAVRIEVEAKLPAGTPAGTWPAIWMLPTDSVSHPAMPYVLPDCARELEHALARITHCCACA